jgi:hypothetical protein
VDCQGGAAEFNEIVIAEGIDDGQVSAKQVFQLILPVATSKSVSGR